MSQVWVPYLHALDCFGGGEEKGSNLYKLYREERGQVLFQGDD